MILRLFIILSAIAIIMSGVMYLFTRNRRYLRLTWQIVRFVVYLLLVFGLLYVLERYVLVGVRSLL